MLRRERWRPHLGKGLDDCRWLAHQQHVPRPPQQLAWHAQPVLGHVLGVQQGRVARAQQLLANHPAAVGVLGRQHLLGERADGAALAQRSALMVRRWHSAADRWRGWAE